MAPSPRSDHTFAWIGCHDVEKTADKIVTEYGIAEMRGRTLRQRAEALISIAAPQFREELTKEAKAMAII